MTILSSHFARYISHNRTAIVLAALCLIDASIWVGLLHLHTLKLEFVALLLALSGLLLLTDNFVARWVALGASGIRLIISIMLTVLILTLNDAIGAVFIFFLPAATLFGLLAVNVVARASLRKNAYGYSIFGVLGYGLPVLAMIVQEIRNYSW